MVIVTHRTRHGHIYIYIYTYNHTYLLYLIEKTTPAASTKTLRRDFAINLATEPCENLAKYLATDTLRRGKVCGESLATGTFRRPYHVPNRRICMVLMFQSMLQGFLATEALSNIASKKGKINTCSEILATSLRRFVFNYFLDGI